MTNLINNETINPFERLMNLSCEGSQSEEVADIIIKNCISRGANINDKNDNGDTPLHEAARHAHVFVISALLNNGATLQYNNSHETPVDLAPEGLDDFINEKKQSLDYINGQKTFNGKIMTKLGSVALYSQNLLGKSFKLSAQGSNKSAGCTETSAKTIKKMSENCEVEYSYIHLATAILKLGMIANTRNIYSLSPNELSALSWAASIGSSSALNLASNVLKTSAEFLDESGNKLIKPYVEQKYL